MGTMNQSRIHILIVLLLLYLICASGKTQPKSRFWLVETSDKASDDKIIYNNKEQKRINHKREHMRQDYYSVENEDWMDKSIEAPSDAVWVDNPDAWAKPSPAPAPVNPDDHDLSYYEE